MYKLGNRVLFRLSGPDSFNFLQGLVTADMNLVTGKEARPGLFLSSMGHVLSECFVFKHNDAYYLDSLGGNYSRILSIVKKRKLASRVNITPVESDVYVQLPRVTKYLFGYNTNTINNNNGTNGSSNSSSTNKTSNKENMLKLLDIRGRYFGYRYYDLLGNVDSKDKEDKEREKLGEGKEELGVYEKNLMLNSCLYDFLVTRPSYRYFNNDFVNNMNTDTSSNRDSNSSSTNKTSTTSTTSSNSEDQNWVDGLKLMAFDLNLERFNYIGSNKGCYIGQEMVNRVLNMMLINKYVLYFAVNNRVLEMDSDKLMDEDVMELNNSITSSRDSNSSSTNKTSTTTSNNNNKYEEEREEQELDVVDSFGELTLTKCVNRLLKNNNKLLSEKQQLKGHQNNSNNNLLLEQLENKINRDETNRNNSSSNFNSRINSTNNTINFNNLLQKQEKQQHENNENNNKLLERQEKLLNNYAATYKLLKYLFSSKIKVSSLNVLSEEVKKLVDSKRLVFVVFSERFGFVLINRNLQMKHLNVNGNMYTLEPVF